MTNKVTLGNHAKRKARAYPARARRYEKGLEASRDCLQSTVNIDDQTRRNSDHHTLLITTVLLPSEEYFRFIYFLDR